MKTNGRSRGFGQGPGRAVSRLGGSLVGSGSQARSLGTPRLVGRLPGTASVGAHGWRGVLAARCSGAGGRGVWAGCRARTGAVLGAWVLRAVAALGRAGRAARPGALGMAPGAVRAARLGVRSEGRSGSAPRREQGRREREPIGREEREKGARERDQGRRRL
jgi:hypothetical protein